MSTNINDVNKSIFDRLKLFVPDHLKHNIASDDSEPRRIRANSEELEFLKKSKIIDQAFVLPNKSVLKIKYRSSEGDERFFISIPEEYNEVIGVDPFMKGVIGRFSDNTNYSSELLNDNAGLLTLIWGNSINYPLSITDSIGELLIEQIFGLTGFYELKEVKPFFAKCDIWEVDKDGFELSPYCLYGGWLTQVSSKLGITFSSETLITYRKLFEESFGFFVGEPLFKSLTSTHFEHSFLECYRCIERLYHIPFIQRLLHVTKDTTPSEFASLIEDKLGWRPKEEDALKNLIKLLEDEQLYNEFYNVLKINTQNRNPPYSKQNITDLAAQLLLHFGRQFKEHIPEDILTSLVASPSSGSEMAAGIEERNDLSDHLLKSIEEKLNDSLPQILTSQKGNELIVREISKEIYQLRNSIAHWRPSGDDASKKHPEDWDLFIRLICTLVFKLYSQFKDEI